MLKKIVLSSAFLLSSFSFANQAQPSQQHVCKAAEFAMEKFETLYIPNDRDSCKSNDDCTFLSKTAWTPAKGINKTSLAAYRLMLNNSNYKELEKQVEENCGRMHPMVIIGLPKSTECLQNKCVPNFHITAHDEN